MREFEIPFEVKRHQLGFYTAAGNKPNKVLIKNDISHYPQLSAGYVPEMIAEFYEKSGIETEIFDYESLDIDVGGTTVTLDSSLSADFYLGLTRVFAAYDKQETPISTLVNQERTDFRALSGETVTIVDDDTMSGWNLSIARNYLESFGVKVNSHAKLVFDMGPYDDIVDVSDFVPGAAGLMVKFPGGETRREPYHRPVVNPVTRASCPIDRLTEYDTLCCNIVAEVR